MRAIIAEGKERDSFIKNIKTGMCLLNDEIPYFDAEGDKKHPLIVFSVDKNTVSCVMAKTLYSDSQLDKDKIKLPTGPCPLERNRRRFFAVNQIYVFFIEDIKNNHKFQICCQKKINDGENFAERDYFNSGAIAIIQNGVKEYQTEYKNKTKYYYNGEFLEQEKIDQVFLGYGNNLNDEQIAIYAKGKYAPEQMEQIRISLEYGLNNKQVESYIKHTPIKNLIEEFTRINTGLKRIKQEGPSIEQVSRTKENQFDDEQKRIFYKSMGSNLPPSKIKIFMHPAIEAKKMREFYHAAVIDCPNKLLEHYAKKEHGGDVLKIFNFCKRHDTINKNDYIRLRDNLPSKSFNEEQIAQIALGIYHKVDFTLYTNPNISAGAMEQIRLGSEHGLTKQLIDVYVGHGFLPQQMKEIRIALEEGIKPEYLTPLLDKNLSPEEIEEKRSALEEELFW